MSLVVFAIRLALFFIVTHTHTHTHTHARTRLATNVHPLLVFFFVSKKITCCHKKLHNLKPVRIIVLHVNTCHIFEKLMNSALKKKKPSLAQKSVFSGQQEVEHVEEHLVIIGCTNNVPAPSLFSNSSEVDTRNGWLLLINRFVCLLQTSWKRGRELVHCLYSQ